MIVYKIITTSHMEKSNSSVSEIKQGQYSENIQAGKVRVLEISIFSQSHAEEKYTPPYERDEESWTKNPNNGNNL